MSVFFFIKDLQIVVLSYRRFLPIITNVIFIANNSGLPSTMAAHRQASAAAKNVAQKSHFLPVRLMMYMASAMAGISTKPASA